MRSHSRTRLYSLSSGERVSPREMHVSCIPYKSATEVSIGIFPMHLEIRASAMLRLEECDEDDENVQVATGSYPDLGGKLHDNAVGVCCVGFYRQRLPPEGLRWLYAFSWSIVHGTSRCHLHQVPSTPALGRRRVCFDGCFGASSHHASELHDQTHHGDFAKRT